MMQKYLVSTVIVWTAVLIASALVLMDSSYFGQILAILGGGAVWFVVLVPGGILRHGSDDR